MNMILRILSIVSPIFLIVMIGLAHGRKCRPDMTAANTLNISVFLPALFFSALAGKTFNLVDNIPIALGSAAVVLGLTLSLTPTEQAMLFVFGALPPAVSCFIFAERYEQEPEKVASIVIIGNAAALVFIPLALALRL